MKVIGFESFDGKSKKDGSSYTCLKYYLGNDLNDDRHQGFTSIESGMIFNFSKDQAKRIAKFFDEGTEVMCLYNKRGFLYDVQEVVKK